MDENDLTAASTYFTAGIEEDDPRCAYGLVALSAKEGKMLDDAIKQLQAHLPQIEAMAENRDADACFILGRCYETGSAVPRSIPAAISWYIRAASLGSADAMFNLGCIYMNLDPNAEALALEQFHKAAERGCMEAAQALAHYYHQ